MDGSREEDKRGSYARKKILCTPLADVAAVAAFSINFVTDLK